MAAAEGHAPRAPLDLTHHFSKTTRSRGYNSMKAFYRYFMIPGIGNLAGGTLPSIVVDGAWGCAYRLVGRRLLTMEFFGTHRSS